MIRAAAVLALATFPADAYTLGGAVTGGTGQGDFVKLEADQRIVVGRDTYQNDNLYAFDEDQNITLKADIRVNIGPYGEIIPAGSIIASHYVFFDPAFGTSQSGYVDFDSPILGVATLAETMAATDFLANTDVTYLNPHLRGLERNDLVFIDPDNPFRLRVIWRASTPGDYIRVFTAKSPGV